MQAGTNNTGPESGSEYGSAKYKVQLLNRRQFLKWAYEDEYIVGVRNTLELGFASVMLKRISFDSLGEKRGQSGYILLENCSRPGAPQIIYAHININMLQIRQQVHCFKST